jgi:lysophospholipid acyltransferase (LPLAT)-like uncharacterized protein
MRPVKPIIVSIKNSRILSFLAKNALYVVLRLLFMTYRLQVQYPKSTTDSLKDFHGVFYFWHQHILSGMFFFFRQKAQGACVVSPSNDGKIAGYFCQRLGFRVLYGSSHKASIQLIRQALAELETNGRLCLVGDGSRGPAFKLQRGITYLAEKTQQPLCFVECKPTRTLTLKKSWDQFKIPLPFSKIEVIVHEPVFVNPMVGPDNVRKSSLTERI